MVSMDDDRRRSSRMASPKALSNSIQVLEFISGNSIFSVDLFDVREVITSPLITPIPNAPPFILGMIDLRETITTIIDLKKMMHIDQGESLKKGSRIIIIDKTVCMKMIGLLVDDVLAVSTYTRDDIDERTESSEHNMRDIIGIIRKVAHEGEGIERHDLVILLDIRKMIQRIEHEL